MKYIFFGTPEFAAIILEKLINAGFIPEAVVCNPDKPVGRKKIITPPPVKKCVMNQVSSVKNKIKIIQPKNILELKKLDYLTHDTCDLSIVAAYAKILPKEILEIPRLGTIGVHPSLLPKYRGPSPIQTAILNGDEETGVTLYLVDEGLDSGAILANRKAQIAKRNYKELEKILAELGADLLIEFLQKTNQFLGSQTPLSIMNIMEVELPYIKPLLQDESQATYTKKFTTQDAYIELKDLKMAQEQDGEAAIIIDRKIRALNPEPGVWTIKENKRIKILEAILTPEGKLKLKKIQFEGKKPIDISN